MKFYEISALMDNLWMKNKESWEQTRAVGYITAQVNSTKTLTPESLMEFTWEKKKKKTVLLSEEEMKAMEREMKEMKDKLNGKI